MSEKQGILDTNSITSSDEDEDQQVPITFSSRLSIFGRIRTISNVKLLEWSFIIVSVVSILVGFGFTLYRMSTIPPDSDQFVFALLVLINLVIASYYLLNGVFQEQPFEISAYILTNLLLGALVTINFTSEDAEKDKYLLIRFIVTMSVSLPNCLIGCTLGWQYWTSGALIFKTVGGDMKLQKMCRLYFLGLSLLVFDAQATTSCIILVLEKGVTGMNNEEIIVLVVGTVFTAVWFVIGYTGMRTENLKMSWLFAISSIIQPLYVLYLFVQGFVQPTGQYSIRTKSAFLAGAILLLTHFMLLATLCMIGSNYGKGLREAIYGEDGTRNRNNLSQRGNVSIEVTDNDSQPLIQPGPSRIQTYDAI